MKSELVYLQHMHECASKAVSKMSDKTRQDFDADENLQLALVHLIQVLGEAARRVGEATRAHYPEIPFRQIVGMRHKVVHDYMDVDLNIVYSVVTQDLPPLIDILARILPKEN